MRTIETDRLILRPWKVSDAVSLYEHAKNPNVGPMAGWPVHTDEEESFQVIREVLCAEENYAVVVKAQNDNCAVGSVGLMLGAASNLGIGADEAEIGYWIGEPFWGQGLIPEAVNALLRHAFVDLGVPVVWCGFFDGNEKSRRVNEKCGFRHHHTEYDKPWPLIDAVKTQHITCMAKAQWLGLGKSEKTGGDGMKIAVRYQSRGGNTKAAAEVMAKAAGVAALPISEAITEPVDVLFVGGGMYAWDIDKTLRAYLTDADFSMVKTVAVFTTAGGMDGTKKMAEVLSAKGVAVHAARLPMKIGLYNHTALRFGRERSAEDVVTLSDKQIGQINDFVKKVLAV